MDSQKRKKVLVITYYWPPAGGPGVQRVLKFVKYLPEFGWEPIILTVKNGEYPALDQSLKGDIPKSLKVYQTKTIEFFSLFKFFARKKKDSKIDTFILDKKSISFKQRVFKWIRANLFIPDARIGWYSFAIRKAKKIITEEGIDLILSSSPPATVQVIATKLKKNTGIKWIADLRDPWVDAFWESQIKRISFSQKWIETQEKEALTNADHIITATNSFKSLFRKKYNISNITTLTNGYDLSDFGKANQLIETEKFTITYTGSIAESQNPKKFFQAIKFLPNSIRSHIEVNLYGAIDPAISNYLNELDIKDVVKFKGYISHKSVVDVMSNSHLLILLIPENRGDIIPGKLFEYMASGNTIISFGPNGDASEIINEHNFGRHFEFGEDCSDYILECFKNWKANPGFHRKTPPEKYSRVNLTKKLAMIMNNSLA